MSARETFERLAAMKDLCADLEAAGYRIVGPGEMDAKTLERAAQEMECRAQWALDEAKKIVDEWVTVEGISAEDKADNRQEARRYREMSPIYRSAAAVIRDLAKGGQDG